jgi:hypothetical protein
MKLSFIPLIGVLAALSAPAQDTKQSPESRPLTPLEKVEAIDKEFDAARDEFFKAYHAAATPEEKQKLFAEKFPKAEALFPRLMEIVKADSKGEGAESALVWIVTHDQSGKKSAEALDAIERDHLDGKGLAELTDALGGMTTERAEKLLKAIEEKNPDRAIKGRALYAQAEQKKQLVSSAAYLKNAKTEEEKKEAAEYFSPEDIKRLESLDTSGIEKQVEEILVRVQAKYADVKAGYGGTLGERAEGDLFEIRSLAIGKVAPDIEGESVQGKPMKLSDFKGKVVVLDFWGHW